MFLAEAAELKANPGKWAKLDTSHLSPTTRRNLAASIHAGRVRVFAEGFEAVTRSSETWVRYTGN